MMKWKVVLPTQFSKHHTPISADNFFQLTFTHKRKKPHASLDAHETYYWDRGSHSPDIVQEKLRWGYWFLLLETFAATRRPPLHHYEFDNVKALGSQRIFQSDTPLLLCLSGLFPLSDPWYSSHSPSHRPSTSLLCVLQLSLSRTTPHRYSV